MATRLSQYRKVSPALVEQREVPRHRLTIKRATLRRHGATATDAMLHDLSIYGCRLAAEAQAIGERLWLRFDGRAAVAATVIWSADGFIGCRFDTPIDRGLVRSLTLVIV